MAPWEELPYFRLPVETYYSAPTPGTQLCKSDPQRVQLVISPGGSTSVFVSTTPHPATNQGISISQTIPFNLSAHTDMGLVQAAWYCSNAASSPVTVIEVLLIRWPQEPQQQQMDRDRARAYAAYLGRLQASKSRAERAAELVRKIREGRV